MQVRRRARPRATRNRPHSAPFDLPCGDGFLGVHHRAGVLVTALSVHAGAPGPERLENPWSGRDRTPGIAWNSLRQWMTRPDGAATSVTVLTEGRSGLHDGPTAAAYRTLTGPLSVAAERRVHVLLEFAPLDHPGLVAAYGTGTAAALRACRSLTGRLAALLSADGPVATGVTAAELTGLSTRLHEEGPPTAVLTDDPHALPAAMESVWRTAGAATTALRWSVESGAPVVRAHLGSGAAAASRPSTPGTARVDRPLPGATVPALGGAVLPVAGAGVIVGADHRGRPVTLRLAGSDVPLAEAACDLEAVHRLVARLTAVGIGAAVFTDRPRQWAGLIDAVADPRLLHPAADGPAPLLIDDRPGHRLGPLAGSTVLRVTGPGRPELADTGAPVWLAEADDTDRARVTGNGRHLRIRSVTTPAEDALVRVGAGDRLTLR